MNRTERSRMILGLRAVGWSEKEINNFVLYIEFGGKQVTVQPAAAHLLRSEQPITPVGQESAPFAAGKLSMGRIV